jgi:hypothetical protein
MPTCPLCLKTEIDNFFKYRNKAYFQCNNCNLIFLLPKDFISEEEEKENYDLHENDMQDIGYQKFLNRMFEPMMKRIVKGASGLDFGSGSAPMLSAMFEESGFKMDVYDHFYSKNKAVLKRKYDFITATEVVEHLHKPKKVLDDLWAILKQGGTLGLMTKLSTGTDSFAKWHYKDDPTHVCFYSKKSFEWLAAEWQADLEFIEKDIVLLNKITLTP